jgi:hypothetical protein
MTKRFVMRSEADASWTVYDLGNGHPAIVDDRLLIGIPLNQAHDLAEHLNRRSAEIHGLQAA